MWKSTYQCTEYIWKFPQNSNSSLPSHVESLNLIHLCPPTHPYKLPGPLVLSPTTTAVPSACVGKWDRATTEVYWVCLWSSKRLSEPDSWKFLPLLIWGNTNFPLNRLKARLVWLYRLYYHKFHSLLQDHLTIIIIWCICYNTESWALAQDYWGGERGALITCIN